MRILTGIGLLAILSGGLFAQTKPEFEAADVHRSAPAMNPYTFISGGVLRGARYDLRKASMLDLIRIACGVKPEMVWGGPNFRGEPLLHRNCALSRKPGVISRVAFESV